MPTQRQHRVARQLLQEISKLVEFELKDPRLGLVTLTDTWVSADLRTARIYFSTLGDEAAKASSMAALEHACGFLRRQVGQRLRLKYVPELRFEHDDSLERADQIARLLADEKRAADPGNEENDDDHDGG